MLRQAPFPWFGGKSRVAGIVWEAFGDVPNYVEPFFGSGAVLLRRPHVAKIETVNDKDGFVANFWRAVTADPEQVAHHADWPVNENDQHARHIWLVGQRAMLTPRLEGDPEYYDAKIAGWWVWGICCWIGAGWCSGDGPWRVTDGQLLDMGADGSAVERKRPSLSNAGRGVHRQLVHLGDAGQGVHRQLAEQANWFIALAERLRHVRVCCGDWTRVCGPTPTVKQGVTGVFLDPPYGAAAGRQAELYAEDSFTAAENVRQWAIAHGGDQRLRIALCGYDDQEMPSGWASIAWKASGGYGSQGDGRGRANASRELLWLSPHCLDMPLFTETALPLEIGA